MRAEDFMKWVDDSDPDGCWPWLRGGVGAGYGVMWLSEGPVYTHIFSYRKFKGKIKKGLSVLHTCDNPPCVNPTHLFLGTDADNAADKVAKGRCNTPKGEASSQAKLTEEQVRIIRVSSDISNRELGRIHGVTHGIIGNIKRRIDWKHVL